ncbi:MAG: hypothetical protein H2174_10800 [Vampirovibrio sp.]|nr:hypothetical protein [Vampirovibrio sp.]
MNQQAISSNTTYPLMSSVSVKSKPLPTKLKTVEQPPLPRSTNDSFEAKHGAETAKMASPKPTAKEQGVPLIGTALIALASLGVGIGGVLTARHFNWFELGQKVETKTIKELPETLTKLLNVGDNPTEEQAIKAVEKLKQADITVQSQLEQVKQELAEGAEKLIKAQEEIGMQENRILLLADETGHANQQLDLVKTELQDVLQTGLDLQQQNEELRTICQNFLASMEKEDAPLGLNTPEANFENSTGEQPLYIVNDWDAEAMYQVTLDSDSKSLESIGTGNVEQSSEELDAIVESFNLNLNQTDKTFDVTGKNGKSFILSVQNPIKDDYSIPDERIKWLVEQSLNPKSSTNTRGSDTVPAEALEISLPQQEEITLEVNP